MSSGKHVELDVSGMLAKTRGETTGDFGGEEFVLGSCNVKNRCSDRVVFVFFPVLGDTTADSDNSCGLCGISPDEAIVQADGLRKAHENRLRRGNTEPRLKRGGNRADDVVVLPDICFRMRARAPVVSDFIAGGISGDIMLVRSA